MGLFLSYGLTAQSMEHKKEKKSPSTKVFLYRCGFLGLLATSTICLSFAVNQVRNISCSSDTPTAVQITETSETLEPEYRLTIPGISAFNVPAEWCTFYYANYSRPPVSWNELIQSCRASCSGWCAGRVGSGCSIPPNYPGCPQDPTYSRHE